MYQFAMKEFFYVALLLRMVYYGQAYFSVQPPSVVVGVADQPVTQLECRANCWQFTRSAESCTIKWHRWIDADVPQALSDNSCHRLPYSEWTDRKASNPFSVAVHSKLIINKFTPAYSGRYFCSLKTLGKVVTSNNVTLKAANASYPMDNQVQNCCLPSIQSIKARLLPRENGSMCANVTWNEVPSDDCQIMPWRLTQLEWDRPPRYDFANDGNITNSYEVVNGSWSKICGLTTEKYYQFRLSTLVKPYNSSLKFGSHTYFFGKSSPAKIVYTDNYKEVLEGDELVITCNASGMPTPNVQMLKVILATPHLSGTNHEPLPASTPVVTKRKVIKSATPSDSGRYLCIASNTLVNPPQGLRKITSTAIITVKVLKRSESSNR